ncbi:MAG: hypothetical protein N3D79_06515 [Acidilobaceae archaeon]|nr:hypothetical protein [Acidilobaceae archaeon]
MLFILAIFFLPFMFTLIDRVPSIFLFSQGGNIGIGSSIPQGATGIDLKTIVVLVLFLLPVFFVIAVADKYAARV